MRAQLHIVAVEDGVTDAEIIERHLTNAGLKCVVRQVQTEGDFTSALPRHAPEDSRGDQELRLRLEAVGRLAAGIAHEIDALIQHISGNRTRG
jgi:hypothetical protein